jgi:hypothetical protein
VIQELKALVESVDPRAPMLVVGFKEFESFRKLPRSDDDVRRVEVSQLRADAKLVFISHRWLRPWHTREECEAKGQKWQGMPHPDDDMGKKHKLICAGIVKLSEVKGWNIDKVSVWLDFCSVDQVNTEMLLAGITSLRGYISVCDAMLIPSLEVRYVGCWSLNHTHSNLGIMKHTILSGACRW